MSLVLEQAFEVIRVGRAGIPSLLLVLMEEVEADGSTVSAEMNRSPIGREFAERFAEEWIAAWNAHDLARVLSYYEDDFEMASPLIVEIAGEPSGVLRGKERIRAYWEEGLRRSPALHFEKLGMFVGVRSLVIHLRNQNGRSSVEAFEIGDHGRVTRAAAHYA